MWCFCRVWVLYGGRGRCRLSWQFSIDQLGIVRNRERTIIAPIKVLKVVCSQMDLWNPFCSSFVKYLNAGGRKKHGSASFQDVPAAYSSILFPVAGSIFVAHNQWELLYNTSADTATKM